jgi:hypothetical protein
MSSCELSNDSSVALPAVSLIKKMDEFGFTLTSRAGERGRENKGSGKSSKRTGKKRKRKKKTGKKKGIER